MYPPSESHACVKSAAKNNVKTEGIMIAMQYLKKMQVLDNGCLQHHVKAKPRLYTLNNKATGTSGSITLRLSARHEQIEMARRLVGTR